ncbi:MAG TPA: hypothetical protein PLO67_05105 [Saprospiraceae bacterium]|nr:hypothetical protein [Saprospiraceae bacterium]HPI07333.1 hypothetical protein [Saprospiraceae bacterium]
MDFDVLKDLVQTITRNKIKNIEVLGNPGEEKSRVELMYDGISSGKFKSEDDVARHFFKSDAKDANYRKLKNKLIRQLVNTAFFVDVNQPAFNERAKAYFTAYRDFAAGVVLMTRNAVKSGIYIFQLVLEQAVKYEFTDLAADVSRILRREYARVGGDYEKNQYYTNLHRRYEEKKRCEILATDYYETLVSYYLTKRSPNEDIHQLASTYFNELFPMAETVDTSAFYSTMFSVGIIKFSSVNDIENAIKICEDALGILMPRKNTNRSTLVGITLQKIAFYIQLRSSNSTEIKDLFRYALSILEEGDFNWFRAHEIYFYSCIYSRNYNEALDIFEKIVQSSSFQLLEGSHHDNWLLLGGYLHLLAKLGVLNAAKVESIVGTFKFGKFFNEIEVLDKDKEGMNIPLVLLPVLFHLAQKTFDDQNDISVDALEKYRQRWLANDMNRRSDSFLKMLIAFAKKDYASAAAEKKISKELEILKSETPQVAGQNFAVEVVPYETLWELLNSRG